MERKPISWEYSKRGQELKDPMQKAVREAKTRVCAEFEKVCQTDKALQRMVKEMHDIFDRLEKEIQSIQA